MIESKANFMMTFVNKVEDINNLIYKIKTKVELEVMINVMFKII